MFCTDCEKLLSVSARLGASLLKSGAEIYRVEDSMQRIFSAYGIEGGIFATSTCIIASLTDEQGHSVSKTLRIHFRTTDLDRVAELNDLCRRICSSPPSLEEFEREVFKIEQRPVYPFSLTVIAFAVISFSFTLFFGGSIFDALCALFIGMIVKSITTGMEKLNTNQFFTYIAGSAVGAALAMLAVGLHLAGNADKIIIGIFMNLVPGIAMTNAIRDIIAGDLVAGSSKIMEALLIGIALALGAGIAISGVRLALGG